MSQPHGRYSGSRDKGPRQSQQLATTAPHRQKKPYLKAQPARDASQTASIFKTRSFKWLVETVGAENIALALDSNLPRVAELINGERFTPETAFHIETTLGLPDGFFDQPNPALAEDTIRRLRAPLGFSQLGFESESARKEALDGTPSPLSDDHSTLNAPLSRNSDMPKRTGGGARPPVTKKESAAEKHVPLPLSKPAVKAKATRKSSPQQPLPLNDVATLQNTRRANLHVLTSRKGSKIRLSAVMNISASNLDNRLYGQKRMDDVEASRFTDRLGLPTAWLDIPRSLADIPESVSALLDPLVGKPASEKPGLPVVVESEVTVARKQLGGKAKRLRVGDAHAPLKDRTDDTPSTNAVVDDRDSTPSSVSDPLILKPDGGNASAPASSPQAVLGSNIAVAEEPRRGAPVTSLDNLIGISPIAEALIKTLAGKARTGRLDEIKALELLQQIVSL